MKWIGALIAVSLACVLDTHSILGAPDSTAELEKLEKKVNGTTALVRKRLGPAARTTFDATGELPTSDEFINKIRPQIKDYQQILLNVSSLRKKLAKKAVDAAAAEVRRLDEVERQVTKVIGGSDRFAQGAKWTGSMQLDGRGLRIDLEIQQSEGGAFSGEFAETTRSGRPARMKMSGSVNNRDEIIIGTGDMILGEPCSRACAGSVFRNRMIANVQTIDKGKKAPLVNAGTLELTFIPPKPKKSQ